ncbi:biotin synthase [Azospirillaceae bacterium]
MKSLDALLASTSFSDEEIVYLLSLALPSEVQKLQRAAYNVATDEIGETVYYRGLVEFSNICAMDCHYCGIRKSNRNIERYCLTQDDVVESALWCARAGYGSCVLQSGERHDPRFVRFVEECIKEIRRSSVSEALPQGLGVTLSLGEHPLEAYQTWRNAGAHRYLLRIETTNQKIFEKIHPSTQRFEERILALRNVREAGFHVGTGVMIGLPEQTLEDLCADIRFFVEQDVDMIGMGPYIVSQGGAMIERGMMDKEPLLQLALNMIAVTRLVLRDVNIASTTALQALTHDGREKGILYGANIIMPNITPRDVRKNYQLYEGKPCLDEGRGECRGCLERRVISTGRCVGWNEWGDSRHFRKRTVS